MATGGVVLSGVAAVVVCPGIGRAWINDDGRRSAVAADGRADLARVLQQQKNTDGMVFSGRYFIGPLRDGMQNGVVKAIRWASGKKRENGLCFFLLGGRMGKERRTVSQSSR